MKRQTKVVLATALFAMGASLTAMAAEKGTWVMEDGEWYCYDSDGDVIENEFCLSNGKEYYVGDDGTLVCSAWVEDDGDYYYVNSAGEKIKNEWRYTAPYEDEEGDEEWYYFKSNGKRAEDEKLVIGGKTYFFNGDGAMLTGWVYGDSEGYDEASTEELGGKTYYCDEDGARVSKAWVKTYAPGVDEDEDDVDEDDMNWYYIKSSGEPATKKQSNINGQTYFFNKNGVMLSGWVVVTSDSNCEEIWVEDETTNVTLSQVISEGSDVYFCGDEEDGHAKKGRWFMTYANTDYGMDDTDNDEFWFYAESNGKVYVPTEGSAASAAQEYDLDDVTAQNAEDGKIENDSRFSADDAHALAAEKKLNGEYYLFNQDGQMLYGFIEMDGEVYYYGGSNDGAKKDGSFTVTDDCGETVKCYFATETTSTGYVDNAGVNGAKNGKLYAFGVLVKAEDAKYEMKTVSGNCFIVNKSGSIQSDTSVYKEDGEELFGSQTFTYVKDKGVTYNSIKTAK